MKPNWAVNLGELVSFNTLVVFGNAVSVNIWCDGDKSETLADILERAKRDRSLKDHADEIRDMVPISFKHAPNKLVLGLPEAIPYYPLTPRAGLEAMRAAAAS
ncbi:MAG: hypothetical protein EXS51_02000 [Candidatus Taylorbacteria bacterium]|nr:hypothetical protein [Candidatus Taylorbacteria bacterium]